MFWGHGYRAYRRYRGCCGVGNQRRYRGCLGSGLIGDIGDVWGQGS